MRRQGRTAPPSGVVSHLSIKDFAMFDEAGQNEAGARRSPAAGPVIPPMDAAAVCVRCGKEVAAV
ncbi:hypothetical protein CR51_33595 [Caballeronia megalochromosomata]|nr:hypothetical protein CR51_33595 [Caballeronia megalochromosomata]